MQKKGRETKKASFFRVMIGDFAEKMGIMKWVVWGPPVKQFGWSRFHADVPDDMIFGPSACLATFKLSPDSLLRNELGLQRIPLQFVCAFRRELCSIDAATLHGPCSPAWHVRLKEEDGQMFFQRGWKEFIKHHDVHQGYFLVFRFDGQSHFNVEVFDTSCCEKKYACADEGFNSSDSSKDSLDIFLGTQHHEDLRRTKNRKNFSASRHSIDRSQPSDAMKRKKSRSEKKQKKEWKEKERSHERNGVEQCLSGSESSSFELSESGGNQGTEIGEAADMDGNIKRSYCVSRRRAVTVEETQKALQEARKFQSSNPYFLVVMLQSYVYDGSPIRVPVSFVADHLPRQAGKISFEVSDGRRWSLSLMFKRCGAELGKGWKDFTFENNLEEGDTCVFELFERKKILFKVHIFRVIQQVVPLTKVPRRKPTKQAPRPK